MAGKGGRFEAQIVVPVGGWAVAATNGLGGPSTVTVAAGSYYLSDLMLEFQTQLNASRPNGWTVTGSFGEAGTGKVTIDDATHYNMSITWTSTDLRDVLGFSGNIVAASSAQTGAAHARGLWIPATPKVTPYGDLVFDRFTDLRQTVGPNGGVNTMQGTSFNGLDEISWPMVSNARAVGTTTVGSFQYFWALLMTGLYSYVTAGSAVTYYWDADSGSNSIVYLVMAADSKLSQVVQGWTGLYPVRLRMVAA